jgi:acyl-CoA thioester hydrolase
MTDQLIEIDGKRYVSHKFRVLYEHTDAMGVAYYSNYFTYFEIGRVEYMRYFGYSYRDFEEDTGGALPVIEACAKYISFAKYDDELEIRTSVNLIGKIKIKFNYEIYRDTEKITEGFTIHPFVDESGKVKKPPEKLLKIINLEKVG